MKIFKLSPGVAHKLIGADFPIICIPTMGGSTGWKIITFSYGRISASILTHYKPYQPFIFTPDYSGGVYKIRPHKEYFFGLDPDNYSLWCH